MHKSISIHIDKHNQKPLYLQIFEEFKKLIENNFFEHAEKLPSIRHLSKKLGLNPVTIINAFRLLEDEGMIEPRKGSGTFVRFNRLRVVDIMQGSLIDELYSSEEIEIMKNGEIALNSDMINFASTIPTSSLFPIDDFKCVINQTIEQDGADAFNYQESLGYEPLRRIICKQISNQGIFTEPGNIQIISGAQQGIDIAAKALIKKGDCIVMENPTYLGAAAVFKSRGAHIEYADMQNDGINIDILLPIMKKHMPKIIYTMPSHQNPTGYNYSIEKRKKLLDLAANFGCYIIEDDFISELNLSGKPPLPAIKSLDTNNRVIFIKSYSKILMPGLRIGFMAVPRSIMPRIANAKHTTDISTSGLIQRAFYRFLDCGMWENHLERVKAAYVNRLGLMLKSLARMKKYGIDYREPEGGLNIWVRIPDSIDIRKLFASACKNGVAFIPGNVFEMNNGISNHCIKLSFANPKEEQIESGMNILEYCLEKMA